MILPLFESAFSGGLELKSPAEYLPRATINFGDIIFI